MTAVGVAGAPRAVLGQQRPPKDAAKETAKETRPFRESTLEELDQQIANLLQQRGGPDAAKLELKIDVCVLARQYAAALPEKLDGKAETAASYLRLAQLRALVQQIDTAKLATPTAAQSQALAKVHAMTYKPLDNASVAATDTSCRLVAETIASVAQVTLVPMRPGKAMAATQVSTDAGDNSLVALATAVQRSNVTPALRKQLFSLTDAAKSARDAAETDSLTHALSDAMDLADGLRTNTALEFAKRQEIETQLAEAIALFIDVRTRDSGAKRLKTFDQYRQTVARVGKIRQNPDAERLGKFFVWAQENPDEGSQGLAAVEAYNKVCERFAERKSLAALPPNVKRAADAVSKQYQSAKATFINDALEIAGAGIMSPPVKQLQSDVAAMTHALDTLDLVENSPKSMDVVLAYKPRPGGTLEKRMILALLGVAGEGKMPTDEAITFLQNVDAIAKLSARIGTGLGNAISPANASEWAGGRAAQLEVKLKSMFTEGASTVAAGGAIEPAVLARLGIAADICDTLRNADAVEELLTKIDPMARWVDWGVSGTEISAILKPYRDATTAAVLAILDGETDSVTRWPRVRTRYELVIAYVKRTEPYVPACAALPEGLNATVCVLGTPLDEQQFTDVRRAGFALKLWATAESAADLTTADRAAMIFTRATTKR